MKHKYNVQIRGNVEHVNHQALQKEMSEQLAGIKGLSIVSRSVELWQQNGVAQVVDNGLNRFTIQLTGNILANSDTTVEAIINAFCEKYPQFVLTFQSITGWQDGYGELKRFNDDGSVYEESITREVEPTKDDLVVEAV